MINENQIVPYETRELPVEEGPWIVFAPHADDESFGMGGTLVKAAAKNIQAHIVIMTDGSLGGQQDDIVETRRLEAIQAARILGMSPPRFLNNQDRNLRHENKTVKQASDLIKEINPAAVFFPGCFELHPDHRATASIVWSALNELSENKIIPVSYEILVQSPINVLVDITGHLDKKILAMEIYESQLAENAYIDIAVALNKLRSLTLRGDISHAEGFFRFSTEDVDVDFESRIMSEIRPYFEK